MGQPCSGARIGCAGGFVGTCHVSPRWTIPVVLPVGVGRGITDQGLSWDGPLDRQRLSIDIGLIRVPTRLVCDEPVDRRSGRNLKRGTLYSHAVQLQTQQILCVKVYTAKFNKISRIWIEIRKKNLQYPPSAEAMWTCSMVGCVVAERVVDRPEIWAFLGLGWVCNRLFILPKSEYCIFSSWSPPPISRSARYPTQIILEMSLCII